MATLIAPTQRQAAGDWILGPEGVIACSFPGYEPRARQIEMCNLVERVLRDGGPALIEAGTGIGKSFAYLIAAILSGKPVVVSTDTIALQEQLVGKDLPFLKQLLDQLLDQPVTFAIAKGRSHYLCPRNCQGLVDDAGLLPEYNQAAEDAKAALRILDNPWDGDRAHLVQLELNEERWQRLSGDDSCTGKSCDYASLCPYLRAKAAYEEARVVVTNHHMYLLHHKLKQDSGGVINVLPEHAIWIADEAHTLADKACDVWGLEVGHKMPAAYVRRVRRQVKRLELNLRDADLDLDSVTRAADAFFRSFHGAARLEQRIDEFPAEALNDFARPAANTLAATLKPVRMALYWALQDVPPDDVEKRGAIERLYSGADQLIEGIEAILDPEPLADHVRYAELSGTEQDRGVTLHCKPVETRPIFHSILEVLDAAVFTSATLASGPGVSGFKSIADELGLSLRDTTTLQAESPFDYRTAVAGYLPREMPDPKSVDYHEALADEIEALIHHTDGGAFVLFTSRADLAAVHRLLQRRLALAGYAVLRQGELSKEQLLASFREDGRGVLFALKTYWTGVDIPGSDLRNVIITKIPFPFFMSPLVQARTARIKARGGNDFGEFMLPRAIRDIKQGFGRLIRSREDSGLFALLDPRIRSSKYGRQILEALPDFDGSGDLAALPRFLPGEAA